MSFRDILVHVARAGAGEAVEVAVRLARAQNARLTGLYALREVAMLRLLTRGDVPYVEDVAEKERTKSAEAERRFRDSASRAGVAHDWLLGEGEPADLLNVLGRLQDLVVVGQTVPDSQEIGWDVAEEMVLIHGQATLVVPGRGTFPTLGTRLLVAWNGSREAAAALRAARPFLKDAETVAVLMGRGRETFSGVTKLPPLDPIAYIGRDTDRVEARTLDAADADAGAAILAHASRMNADLVVMGAYGRSWFREWTLGGATRHVLQAMTRPVLMAR